MEGIPRSIAALALASLAPSCAAPPAQSGNPVGVQPVQPAASAAAPPGVELPRMSHAVAGVDSAAPTVTVVGTRIDVGGVVVGDTAPIVASGRLQRIDGLFENLKNARQAWVAKNPGASFPGVVRLALDRATPSVVMKSVFQTAAFAGYPNEQLAVRTPDGGVGHLDVDAIVPSPTGRPGPPGDRLRVEASSGKYVLVWQTPSTVVSTVDVASLADLSDRVAKTWKEHSAHQSPSDAVVDQAIVYVDDALDYGGIAATVDAVSATTRESAQPGAAGRPRAMNVNLSVVKPRGAGDPLGPGKSLREGALVADPLSTGSLAPKEIQGIVRQHFGALRECYEQGLARSATLTGTARVKFTIALDGTVSSAADEGSTLPDAQAVACIVHEFQKLSFPAPRGGVVTVVYPIVFNPGG
ncbi:MAG: AgmX/PglI C-terminal domain-containing protein [Polyangiaceae bacterium]